MSEHTPMALVEYRGENYWLDEQINTASGATIYTHDSTSEGNDLGEFVVRACNSHDKLLTALKEHVEAFHNMECSPRKLPQECDNYRCVTGRYVIKNAEEK